MDWEQIGRSILEEWKAKREYPEPYATPEEEEYWRQRAEARKILEKAVHKSSRGDLGPLSVCIGAKVFSRDQVAAAVWLESLRNKKRRGRKPDGALGLHVEAVEAFCREWTERNEAAGINDWGNRERMKELACEYVAEFFDDDHPPDREKVLDRLRRPANRRHKSR